MAARRVNQNKVTIDVGGSDNDDSQAHGPYTQDFSGNPSAIFQHVQRQGTHGRPQPQHRLATMGSPNAGARDARTHTPHYAHAIKGFDGEAYQDFDRALQEQHPFFRQMSYGPGVEALEDSLQSHHPSTESESNFRDYLEEKLRSPSPTTLGRKMSTSDMRIASSKAVHEEGADALFRLPATTRGQQGPMRNHNHSFAGHKQRAFALASQPDHYQTNYGQRSTRSDSDTRMPSMRNIFGAPNPAPSALPSDAPSPSSGLPSFTHSPSYPAERNRLGQEGNTEKKRLASAVFDQGSDHTAKRARVSSSHLSQRNHHQATPATNPFHLQLGLVGSAIDVSHHATDLLRALSMRPSQLQAGTANLHCTFFSGDQAHQGGRFGGSRLPFSAAPTSMLGSTSSRTPHAAAFQPRENGSGGLSGGVPAGGVTGAPMLPSAAGLAASNTTVASSTPAQGQTIRHNTRNHQNNVVGRMNNGGNYGADIRGRPPVQAHPPYGIDISAVEILTFYPNALQHPDVIMRLTKAGWSKRDLAKVQLRATGNLTEQKLQTNENRIQKQIGAGGKAYCGMGRDERWSKVNELQDEPMFDDLTADDWDFRHFHDPTYDDLRWEHVSLASLRAGVTVWPSNEDRLLLTECLVYACANPRPTGQLEYTTADFGAIIRILQRGGLRIPAHKDSTHDVQALERVRAIVDQ